MPVFLPGKSHDRGAWWTTVHGVANESKHDLVAKQYPYQCLISSDFPFLSIGKCVAVIHYSGFILHFFISNKVKPLILHCQPLKLLFFLICLFNLFPFFFWIIFFLLIYSHPLCILDTWYLLCMLKISCHSVILTFLFFNSVFWIESSEF